MATAHYWCPAELELMNYIYELLRVRCLPTLVAEPLSVTSHAEGKAGDVGGMVPPPPTTPYRGSDLSDMS